MDPAERSKERSLDHAYKHTVIPPLTDYRNGTLFQLSERAEAKRQEHSVPVARKSRSRSGIVLGAVLFHRQLASYNSVPVLATRTCRRAVRHYSVQPFLCDCAHYRKPFRRAGRTGGGLDCRSSAATCKPQEPSLTSAGVRRRGLRRESVLRVVDNVWLRTETPRMERGAPVGAGRAETCA